MTRINLFLAAGLATVLCSSASAQPNKGANNQTVNLDGSTTSSVNPTANTQNPTQILPSDSNPVQPVNTLSQVGSSDGFAHPFNRVGPPVNPVPTPPSWMALGFGLIGFVTLSRKKSTARS